MAINLYPQVGLVTGSDATGKVRVRFPWLDSDNAAVARVCKHVGPLKADTEVLVVFVGGNSNVPVVVGQL